MKQTLVKDVPIGERFYYGKELVTRIHAPATASDLRYVYAITTQHEVIQVLAIASSSIPEEEDLLIQAYAEQDKPVDKLPYTDELRLIARKVFGVVCDETCYTAYHKLLTIRKSGKLPTKGK